MTSTLIRLGLATLRPHFNGLQRQPYAVAALAMAARAIGQA